MVAFTELTISHEGANDQAVSKWHSQRAAEYEITVEFSGSRVMYRGTWSLRVSPEKIEIISPTMTTLSQRFPYLQTSEELRFLTVEEMFDDIERQRNLIESGEASDALEYVVRFNRDLGYPMDYAANPKQNTFDMDWHINVISLKILKHYDVSTPTPTQP
jgi:hypothetical protein